MSTLTSIRPAALGLERLGTLLLFASHGFGVGAWAVSIPSIKARLELTDGALSLALLAAAIGGVLTMPGAGLLGARLGVAPAARLFAIAAACVIALPTGAWSYPLLVAAALLMGAMGAGLDVSMNVYASDLERRAERPMMSSFHAGWTAGGLIGAAWGTAVFAMGWDARWILAGAAVAAALSAVGSFGLLSAAAASPAHKTFALPGWQILPLGVAVGLCMMLEHAIMDWSGVYLTGTLGVAPANAALGYGTFIGAMLIARVAGDAVVARVGIPAVVRWGGLITAAALVILVVLPVYVGALFALALAGMGMAVIVPSLFSLAGRVGTSPGAGIAMAATTGYAGFLLGPPLMGAVSTAAGLPAAFLLMAGFSAGIALLAGLMPKSAS
jgi:MFS family permease